jgi:thiamine-monophosphate kinase
LGLYVKKSLESFFISQFSSKLIGDDGAVIGKDILVGDAFFENVHFKREWLTLDEIAYKSVIVNISDIYAMNGIPKYGILTVAIPKNFSKNELTLLASGFKKAEKDFNFEIVGGDTISNSKLDISLTILGSLNGKPLKRDGLKFGDFIAHTGTLGKCAKDLKSLFKGWKISKKSPFVKPIIRTRFIKKSANLLTAGLDISDGLFSELSHLSKMSKIGIRLNKKISKNIGCSGEEYQLLFGIKPYNLKKVINIAKNLNTDIKIIGRAVRSSKFKNFCKPHHF